MTVDISEKRFVCEENIFAYINAHSIICWS